MENILQVSELHTLQSDHSKVNYVHQGEGTAVILTHGLAASLHDWDDLLPELANAGYTGYALDLLGHGDSCKPSAHDEYTLEAVFQHYKTWIDTLHLKERLVLVGHSLGGSLCLLYALRYPERVRALVLVNPFFEVDQLPPIMRLVYQRQLLNTSLLDHIPYRLFRLLVDLTSFSFDGRVKHVLPEHVRVQTALDYKRASSGIYNIPRTLPAMTSDLTRIQQPTLLIWGAHDQTLAPSSYPRLAQLLPNVKAAHAMPICGHVPHQCHQEVFNPYVMDFLAGL